MQHTTRKIPEHGPAVIEQCAFILEHLAHGVFTVDERRRITFFNTAAEEITGYRRGDVLGRPCHEIFKNRNCRDFCKLDEAAEVGRKALNFDLEIENPEGLKIPINISVVPILDDQGRVVGGVESFEDRSLIHELLRNIHNSNERFKMVLDTMSSAVVTVDRSGRIQSFNRASEHLTGYRREEAIGHTCREIFQGTLCEGKCPFKKMMDEETDAARRWEMEIRDRSGQRIPVRVSSSLLKNDSGRVVGAVETLDNLSLVYELQKEIKGRYQLGDMVGQGPKIRKIFELLPIFSKGTTTVLITGPTGTGKDVLARIIHSLSDRAEEEFVKVNCASLPENLLESEMFGYKKGAFTGAVADKPGLFQSAHLGTIFLDEIGDLPLSLQAKLLRVLEDQEFYPLGARKTVKVDTRIIAATNQDLKRLVSEQKFRADLYYRLNVINLELPPLAERREDIPLLIRFFQRKLNLSNNKTIINIHPNAMRILLNYNYPGNIRELKNIIEHAHILCQGTQIDINHLPLNIRAPESYEPVFTESRKQGPTGISGAVADAEKKLILNALERHGGSRSKTARFLEMDRSTLWRKMRKYGIDA